MRAGATASFSITWFGYTLGYTSSDSHSQLGNPLADRIVRDAVAKGVTEIERLEAWRRREVGCIDYGQAVRAAKSTDHGWTSYGGVFTEQWVVDSLLDLIGYQPDIDLTESTIVEPACGSGAFVTPIVERLVASAAVFDRPLEALSHCVRAFDLQPDHVDMTRKRVVEILMLAGRQSPEVALDLATAWVRKADFLLDDEVLSATYVVGNPPYIRLEDVPRQHSRRTGLDGRR